MDFRLTTLYDDNDNESHNGKSLSGQGLALSAQHPLIARTRLTSSINLERAVSDPRNRATH
jgi:hypothetical protein